MAASRLKIVIPGDDPPQIQGSPHLDRLKPYGDVELHLDRPGSPEEKYRRTRHATCIINSRALGLPGELLRQLPQLKFITCCGIGTDAIDLPAARELGIVVSNIPGRTAPLVAEHTVALLLGVARRLWYQTNEIKSGRWTMRENYYLGGKMAGLVGCGNIATALVPMLKGLGMKVQAWTFNPSRERAAELGVDFVELETLLRTSDVISLHVKLTDQTRGLIGARELALLKRGSILINTARGAIVDRAALVEALHSGQLFGAGLDVFDQEPLPANHPLLTCEQVVLTPHNADQTPEGMEILNGGVVDNVIAFLEGRPQNRVV
jgi:D-3-phosphoglycerate dehydrogenase